MRLIRMIVDNSAAILGLLTALFGLLAAFGLDLTSEQVGAIMTLAGAIIAVLAAVGTVAKRQVVTLVDNSGVIRNGSASTEPTGERAMVVEDPSTGLLTPQAPVSPSLLNAA